MDTIAIDFGTSNSLCAIITNGAIDFVDFNNRRSTPTVLFFPEISLIRKEKREYYFGYEAIERRYEDDSYGRLVFSFKGLLADESFDQTVINGFGAFTAEKFCEYFLRKLKTQAEQQYCTIFNNVILGKPVNFDNGATLRLENAARAAGFRNIRFQLEPIAAALSYESSLSMSDQEKITFICDIGGGTSDYAIVKLSAQNAQEVDRSKDILATGGVYKAGETFNSMIMKKHLAYKFGKGAKWGEKGVEFPSHWINALGNWKTLPFLRKEGIRHMIGNTEPDRQKDVQRLADLVNHNLGFKLYAAVDKSKIELSTALNSEIVFRDLDLDEPISRRQFEYLISEIIEEMQQEMFNTISRANLTIQDIDSVVITGGSSKVPAVFNSIRETFGDKKIIPIDSFNSVVAGLAIEANR